jgi:hypothetical protein
MSPTRLGSHVLLLLALAPFALACGAEDAPPARPCDAKCQDSVATRGIRETLKLIYNITLQGNAVGPQDESTPCPSGGTAHVFGFATSNAEHGATEVDLTYEIAQCHYIARDPEPAENYDITLTATVTQTGTIAVQPTASTGLVMQSTSLTFSGTVYDPPLPFTADACEMSLGQSGGKVSGTLCGRDVGVDL